MCEEVMDTKQLTQVGNIAGSSPRPETRMYPEFCSPATILSARWTTRFWNKFAMLRRCLG